MRSSASIAITNTRVAVSAVVLAAAVTGCGAASVRATRAAATVSDSSAASSRGVVSGSCTTAVGDTLTTVAQRVYAQAASGRNVASVTRRFARSTGLARAAAANSPARTSAALVPLLKHQVRRLVVTGSGGRVLARIGHTAALAPVTRSIRDASGAVVGYYRLAVASDAAIVGEIGALTGAKVTVNAPGHHTGPTAASLPVATTTTLAGTAFPTGPLRLRLAMPTPPAALCGTSTAETRSLTIGAIGRRLYATEQASPATRRVLAHVAHDQRLLKAVSANNPAALRSEIVHLFRDRNLHVVRIRAVTARGALVNDVGGPYALAPASTTLRLGGKTIGRATLSIQDDTGYIKLMHRFTGAVVQLSTPAGRIPGSNVAVPGRAYLRHHFTVRAFPSGPLRVTLLT